MPSAMSFSSIAGFIHQNVLKLNSSKFFAGLVMILLNIGSRFVSIKFSKSVETYIKHTASKQMLIFSIAWMGTRDIYTSLSLVAIFTILSEYAFNHDSSYCIIPKSYQEKLVSVIDTNKDGLISEQELAEATAIIVKAKKQKESGEDYDIFNKFDSNGFFEHIQV